MQNINILMIETVIISIIHLLLIHPFDEYNLITVVIFHVIINYIVIHTFTIIHKPITSNFIIYNI